MNQNDEDAGTAAVAPAQVVLNPDLVLLEHVDRTDRELGRIETERARLRTRRSEREAAVTDRDAARDRAKADLDANRTEERAASRRVEELQTGRKAALRVLETGIGNAEAAQRQLERCDALIDEAETAILELMERQDQLSAGFSAGDAAAKEAAAALAAEREVQPGQLATLDQQHAAASAERAQLLAKVPSELRSRYDDFRTRNRWAVARIRANSCEACSMAVQPQMLTDLRNKKLVSCQGCRRWLYPA